MSGETKKGPALRTLKSFEARVRLPAHDLPRGTSGLGAQKVKDYDKIG